MSYSQCLNIYVSYCFSIQITCSIYESSLEEYALGAHLATPLSFSRLTLTTLLLPLRERTKFLTSCNLLHRGATSFMWHSQNIATF